MDFKTAMERIAELEADNERLSKENEALTRRLEVTDASLDTALEDFKAVNSQLIAVRVELGSVKTKLRGTKDSLQQVMKNGRSEAEKLLSAMLARASRVDNADDSSPSEWIIAWVDDLVRGWLGLNETTERLYSEVGDLKRALAKRDDSSPEEKGHEGND